MQTFYNDSGSILAMIFLFTFTNILLTNGKQYIVKIPENAGRSNYRQKFKSFNHGSTYIMTFLLMVDSIENSIRITLNSIYCGTFGIGFYLFVLCHIWKTYLQKISSVLMFPTPFRCIIFAELLLMFGEGLQKIHRWFARGVLKKILVSVISVWLIIVKSFFIKAIL